MAPWPVHSSLNKEINSDAEKNSIHSIKTNRGITEDKSNSFPMKDTTASSVSAEAFNQMEDVTLKLLLDEAISYKSPKDRAGKSETFQVLLDEAESDDSTNKKNKLTERCNGYTDNYGLGGIGNGHIHGQDGVTDKSSSYLSLEKDRRKKKQKRDRSKNGRNNGGGGGGGNNRKSSKFNHSLKINPGSNGATYNSLHSSGSNSLSHKSGSDHKKAPITTTKAIKMPICTTAVTSNSSYSAGNASNTTQSSMDYSRFLRTVSDPNNEDSGVGGRATASDLATAAAANVTDKSVSSNGNYKVNSETDDDEEAVEMKLLDSKSFTARANFEISGSEEKLQQQQQNLISSNASKSQALSFNCLRAEASGAAFPLHNLLSSSRKINPDPVEHEEVRDHIVTHVRGPENPVTNAESGGEFSPPAHNPNDAKKKIMEPPPNLFAIPAWTIPGFHYMNFSTDDGVPCPRTNVFQKPNQQSKYGADDEGGSSLNDSSKTSARADRLRTRRIKKNELKQQQQQDKLFVPESVENYKGNLTVSQIMEYINENNNNTITTKKNIGRKDSKTSVDEKPGKISIVEIIDPKPQQQKPVEKIITKNKITQESKENGGGVSEAVSGLEDLNNNSSSKSSKKNKKSSSIDETVLIHKTEKSSSTDKHKSAAVSNFKKHASLEELKSSKKHRRENSVDQQQIITIVAVNNECNNKNKNSNLKKSDSLDAINDKTTTTTTDKIKKDNNNKKKKFSSDDNKKQQPQQQDSSNLKKVRSLEDVKSNNKTVVKKLSTDFVSKQISTATSKAASKISDKEEKIKKQSSDDKEFVLKEVVNESSVNNQPPVKKNRKSLDDMKLSNKPNRTREVRNLKKGNSLEDFEKNDGLIVNKITKKNKKQSEPSTAIIDNELKKNNNHPSTNLRKVESMQGLNGVGNSVNKKQKKMPVQDSKSTKIKKGKSLEDINCSVVGSGGGVGNKNKKNKQSPSVVDDCIKSISAPKIIDSSSKNSNPKNTKLKKMKSLEDINRKINNNEKSKFSSGSDNGKTKSSATSEGANSNLKRGKSLEDVNSTTKSSNKNNKDNKKGSGGGGNLNKRPNTGKEISELPLPASGGKTAVKKKLAPVDKSIIKEFEEFDRQTNFGVESVGGGGGNKNFKNPVPEKSNNKINNKIIDKESFEDVEQKLSDDACLYMDEDFADYTTLEPEFGDSEFAEPEFHLVTKRKRKQKKENGNGGTGGGSSNKFIDSPPSGSNRMNNKFLPPTRNNRKNESFVNEGGITPISGSGRNRYRRRRSVVSAGYDDMISDTDSVQSLPINSSDISTKHKVKKLYVSRDGSPLSSYAASADMQQRHRQNNHKMAVASNTDSTDSYVDCESGLEIGILSIPGGGSSCSLDNDTYDDTATHTTHDKTTKLLVSNVTTTTNNNNHNSSKLLKNNNNKCCDQIIILSDDQEYLDVNSNIDSEYYDCNRFNNNKNTNNKNKINNNNNSNVINNKYNNNNNNKGGNGGAASQQEAKKNNSTKTTPLPNKDCTKNNFDSNNNVNSNNNDDNYQEELTKKSFKRRRNPKIQTEDDSTVENQNLKKIPMENLNKQQQQKIKTNECNVNNNSVQSVGKSSKVGAQKIQSNVQVTNNNNNNKSSSSEGGGKGNKVVKNSIQDSNKGKNIKSESNSTRTTTTKSAVSSKNELAVTGAGTDPAEIIEELQSEVMITTTAIGDAGNSEFLRQPPKLEMKPITLDVIQKLVLVKTKSNSVPNTDEMFVTAASIMKESKYNFSNVVQFVQRGWNDVVDKLAASENSKKVYYVNSQDVNDNFASTVSEF